MTTLALATAVPVIPAPPFELSPATASQFALLAGASLFTTINPVSAAPLFVQMTGHQDPRARTRTARKACLAALVVLVLFAAAGTLLFRFFGITTQAFQITGGILFVLMSIRALLFGGRELPEPDGDDGDPSIVPLAIPLLSGPGAITTVVVLSGQATNLAGKAIVGGAILVVVAASYLVLRTAPRMVALVGPEGRRATEKIVALLTGVIGVQFVLNGLTPVIVEILRSAGRG